MTRLVENGGILKISVLIEAVLANHEILGHPILTKHPPKNSDPDIHSFYLEDHPTNRKWFITLVCQPPIRG